ncbi:MAG: hypothetical protein FK733_01885 [Asgard group archaeon]|nr:hypothetical protein [Asgard group archaeon]
MGEELQKNSWGKIKKFFKSDKVKIVLVISFVISVFILNISFFIRQSINPHSYFINVNDADRLADGTTVVQISELQTAFRANKGKIEEWVSVSALIEIDHEGNIIWDYSPNGLEHHVDHEIISRDGGYFFCDSFKDAIKFVRRSTKEVEWSYRLEDINWTQVNSSWGPNHYYNLPCNQWNLETCIDWSHLNDIDFNDYGTWEGMMISIRNFNLIIEVNYTSARFRDNATAEDIVWYYTGALSHQHNPDYLPNGNILIVDSNNQKLIEVNKTSKEIIWEWTHQSITWPRDCDLMPNNRLLLTDLDKVLIINRTSGEILREFPRIFGGYEADYLIGTNTVLVSCGSSGILIEYDCDTGEIVWRWGSNVLISIAYSNCIFIILYELTWIVTGIFMKSKWKWMLIIPLLILIGFEIYIMIAYHNLVTNIFLLAING